MECLELALQAPTGSNSQGWQWVFVDDPDKKKAIGEVYLANARGYLSSPGAQYAEGDTRGERMGAVRDSATYLAEHMHKAPVLMIPCMEGREDSSPLGGVSFWASLFPAVWSYCLALRSRGLGSCWTTLHLIRDGEKKVADVLGIPYEKYSQGGLFPIAYQRHGFSAGQATARRKPHALEQLVISWRRRTRADATPHRPRPRRRWPN
jgi:nitroreductase